MALYKIDVFTFNDLTKRILVDTGVTFITVQQTYNACRLFEAEPANLDNLSVCRAGGKDPLGPTRQVGITMTLLNGWQVEFQTLPAEVADGNFLGEDAAGDSQSPIFNDVVTRSQDTSAAIVQGTTTITPGDLSAIAGAVWDELIAAHSVSGSFGEFIVRRLLTVAKFFSLRT